MQGQKGLVIEWSRGQAPVNGKYQTRAVGIACEEHSSLYSNVRTERFLALSWGHYNKNFYGRNKLSWSTMFPFSKQALTLGNCDIHVKRKILFINEMKGNKILIKLKVKDQEKF